MFENIMNFFKKLVKLETKETNSKETAKERLHLVLMQDRANVSADFLELMKQEIIDVIKKYIEVEEGEIDVRLTNEVREDGTTGAPSLYANIPIANIKNEIKKEIDNENAEKDVEVKDKLPENEVEEKEEVQENNVSEGTKSEAEEKEEVIEELETVQENKTEK